MERDARPLSPEKRRRTNFEEPSILQAVQYKTEIEECESVARAVEHVDENMLRVGFLFDQLVRKFQTLPSFKLDEIDEVLKHGNVSLERLQLAQSIVRDYWNNRLPLVDAILYTTALPDSGIYRSCRTTREFNQYVTSAENWIESLDLGEGSKARRALAAAKAVQANISQINFLKVGMTGQWSLPALPLIKSKRLLLQVFTHRSADPNFHNHRLEFQGDTILNFIVSNILFDTFPDADEGRLSDWKSRLVCNDNLWKYAMAYNFPNRLHASKEVLTRHEVSNKAWSDTFEAYVAAVTIESGIGTTKSWLSQLVVPELDKLSAPDLDGPVDKNAKTELYRKIGSAQQKITYVEKRQNPFVMEARVGNDTLGVGEDSNRRIAGLKAAMDALLNAPEKIEKYAARRQETERQAKVTGPIADL